MLVIFTLFLSSVSYADSNLSEIFNKHSAVMLLIDPSTGKIFNANIAACQFYGLSKSKLEVLSIQDINLFSKEQIASEIALAKDENRKHFIFKHKISNSDVKTVAVYSVPVVFNSENLQFSIIQDITAEREFKREFWHYQSNLEIIVEQQVNQALIHARDFLFDFIIKSCSPWDKKVTR
jgi:PAS domain S-box-containing protein